MEKSESKIDHESFLNLFSRFHKAGWIKDGYYAQPGVNGVFKCEFNPGQVEKLFDLYNLLVVRQPGKEALLTELGSPTGSDLDALPKLLVYLKKQYLPDQ